MRLAFRIVNHFDRVPAFSAVRKPLKSTTSERDGRVPGGIRTPNLLIRSQLLYPVELQTLSGIFEFRFSIFDWGLGEIVGFDEGDAGG